MKTHTWLREGAEDRLRDVKRLPADGPGEWVKCAKRFKRDLRTRAPDPDNLDWNWMRNSGRSSLKDWNAKAGCCLLGVGRLCDTFENGDRNLRKSDSQGGAIT
jgi:hypothetical protein